jgi:transcriptional regulator with XRE-family HTH domain
LGQYLRKRRRELGQLQREAAAEIGVNPWTYLIWETGKTVPCLTYMPLVVRYLGRDPYGEPETFGAWVRASRRRLGLTRTALARRLELNPSTVKQWEKGECRPWRRNIVKLEAVLGKLDQEWDRAVRQRFVQGSVRSKPKT